MSDCSLLQPNPAFPPECNSLALGNHSARALVRRIVLLALLFAVEAVAISLWLDTASLAHSSGLTRIVGAWGAYALRAVIGFCAIFTTFAFLKKRNTRFAEPGATESPSFSWGLLAGHGCALLVFAELSAVLFTNSATGWWSDAVAASWLVVGVSAIGLAALAFFPWTGWVQLLRGTGYLWVYAAASTVAASLAGGAARLLWRQATYATFGLSKLLLKSVVSPVFADPANQLLGTQAFRVTISPQCSGLEGAGLVLAFGVLWLLLFRRECRFPQSLLLLPAAIVLSFLLNVVRITALILIGHAGFPQIAARGFHSQAGWIFFNIIAVSFCLVIGRVSLFTSRAASAESREAQAENPTAGYLLPFLAILAAGLIAGAATASFEWLYPLRFLAAAAMLWTYRRRYDRLNWKCGWLAPAVGAIVAVMWIAADRAMGHGVAQGMPAELMAAPAATRFGWITLRVLGAVVTVPIAEELAFRGFLLRRLVASDFESVAFSFRSIPWTALLVSSVVFGILHGTRWLPGIAAGLLFGVLLLRRGRMGDAVVAHASANALLAAYVLLFHNWSLW